MNIHLYIVNDCIQVKIYVMQKIMKTDEEKMQRSFDLLILQTSKMLSSWNILSTLPLSLYCAERNFRFRSTHFQMDSTDSFYSFTVLTETKLRI